MRVLFIWCICFFMIHVSIKNEGSPVKKEINSKKADFRTSFNYVMKHEGYYANHKNDLGRETYSGISRRYHPYWYGWRYVDKYKRKSPLKWNTHIPELDFWTLDWYLDLWVKERFYELKDQEVANYVYDFRINGTIGTRLIQKSLNEIGYKVPINNKMDSLTISSINMVNKKKFLKVLKRRRTAFYNAIAKRDSTQRIFLKHWLSRAK